MSSPQHPTGSGPQPWQDQPPQHPGQNMPQPGGQPPGYGSGPGPFGSAPGPAYGPAPGQQHGSAPYGSAPGQNASTPGPYGSGPDQYGSAPGPYGSAPAQYGSAPGHYGSAPGPYGSAPGPYGSAPGQFGAAPAPKQRSGPGLIGPLTLRDLFLLFAGLLALITLFVPYRDYGFDTMTLWHWNVADMGALVFNVLAILLLATAVLVNKLGSGRMRIGSLSLDQFISVLSAMAFTYAFIDLLTSAVYWHVGAYLAFFAALLAFFAGVFTMIPFFAREFTAREDIESHPKARPVSKHTPHPAPVANVPGGSASAPGFAPYGAAPAGAGQPGGPGQPGPGQSVGPGQPGGLSQPGPGEFGAPGQQPGPGGPGQPGPDQVGQQSQFGPPEQPGPQQYGQPAGQQPGAHAYGQPDQQLFGQPDDGQRPSPYAPPQEQDAERQASAYSAPAEDRTDAQDSASPSGEAQSADESGEATGDSSERPTHSTGGGQTYLGARDSDAPQHSQAEPTQAFGFGTGRGQTDARDEQSTASEKPVAPEQSSAPEQQTAEVGDGSHSGAAAAAAGAGALGAGAAVAGAASANSDSERRRGRHAAPGSGEADEAASPQADESVADAGSTGEEAPEVVSPAESSDLVSKVNSKSSDSNAADEEALSSAGWTVQDRPGPDAESTTAPESEEPTQYVPVASYGDRSGTDDDAGAETDRTDEDTVAQTAVDSEPVPSDAGQDNRQDTGRPIIQAFWFAVPEPREAVDPTTGMPVFTIYPGDWYLSLEDNGSWFKVRDSDGREGILRNIEGIQRG